MSPQASAEFAEVHKMPSTNAPSTFVIVLCHISSCHGITYIVTRTGRYEHITPILIQLHWLPVQYRITVKILLLIYKALNGLSPVYLAKLSYFYKIFKVHLEWTVIGAKVSYKDVWWQVFLYIRSKVIEQYTARYSQTKLCWLF